MSFCHCLPEIPFICPFHARGGYTKAEDDADQVWVWNERDDTLGDVTKRMTEKEILNFYFPYWAGELKRKGLVDQINFPNCIDDFIVVHWAWKEKKDHDNQQD